MSIDSPSQNMLIRRPTAVWKGERVWPSVSVDRPISGLRVGIRTEDSWRSFRVIIEQWTQMLHADGAEPVKIVAPIQRVGEARAHYHRLVSDWADDIDCGLSGLCTCGSCTSVAVADAVILEEHNRSTVLIVTSEFDHHARNMATFMGHPDMKALVFPHPLEGRPTKELQQLAVQHYPSLLQLFGVTA